MSPPAPLSPQLRSQRARIAAHALHATHDSRETTKAGRDAFMAPFEREVDPEGLLPGAERQRRAAHARKAYFSKLAFLSAKARRRKRASP
jgi:hypothetical protein